MKKNNTLVRWARSIALAVPAWLGMSLPVYADDSASVRCWYNQPNAATAVATGYKVPAGLTLHRTWRAFSGQMGAHVFYTNQSHRSLRTACEKAVHLPASVREQIPYTDRHVLAWYAQTGGQSYNHQIWHVGDQAPGEPIDRIVAFGDSLSDNGNMYNYSRWTLPHGKSWVVGRFTNGPVWVEYMADMLDVPLNNWSIGGSERDTAKGLIEGIGAQVSSFARYASMDATYDPSRTLFTFLTGANDFMNDDGNADPAIIRAVLARHEDALRDVISLGATKILVLNLPDISKTPAFQDRPPASRIAVRDKVRFYNEGLAHMLKRLRSATGADLRLFAMDAKFDELIENPAAFGMLDASTTCLNLPSRGFIDYLDHVKMNDWCAPDEWVFWDGVHPTTRTHALLATWALRVATDAWGVKAKR